MPRISPERRQARREQIARAAVEQFAARGIHSTSMANIIDASGLSAGALYTHFTGKDEIITYVARTTVSGIFTGFSELLHRSPPPSPGALMERITERIDSADVPVGFIVQVWSEAVTNPSVRDAANEVYGEAFGFLHQYSRSWLSTAGGLDGQQADAQAPRQARLFISLIYAHILQSSMLDSYETPTFLDDVAGLFPSG